MRQVNWKDCQYARYTKKPTAAMLEGSGCVITRNVSINGEAKSKTQRKEVSAVTYDRAYVVSWLGVMAGGLIIQVPRAELLKLITEAKEVAKSRQ